LPDKMIKTSLEVEKDVASSSAPRIECFHALTLGEVLVCRTGRTDPGPGVDCYSRHTETAVWSEERLVVDAAEIPLRELHNNLDPSLPSVYSISPSHFFSFRPIQATAIGSPTRRERVKS
jgi:hypothetical protein